MPLENKDVLLELLKTPSPSSREVEIQKKWINYVEDFAEELITDHAGNAIGVLNKEADFKILLAGHIDEIALVVNRIDDDGFIYFDEVGRFNQKAAVGMNVLIQGYGKELIGVIGVNAQHLGGIKSYFDLSDLFIDVGP